MAFNEDEYIGVIVNQIGQNFQELHKTIQACEAFNKKEKKFKSSYDIIKYEKLANELVVCNGYKSIEPLTVGHFGEWGSGKSHLFF